MNGVDVSKVGALRVAGWDWQQIAEAMGMDWWALYSQWRLHRNLTEYRRWAAREDESAPNIKPKKKVFEECCKQTVTPAVMPRRFLMGFGDP